jgi:hypothetical protein
MGACPECCSRVSPWRASWSRFQCSHCGARLKVGHLAVVSLLALTVPEMAGFTAYAVSGSLFAGAVVSAAALLCIVEVAFRPLPG